MRRGRSRSPPRWNDISGGVAPFTYSWSGFASGTDETITAAGSGRLILDVWDASNPQQHARAIKVVYVDPANQHQCVN